MEPRKPTTVILTVLAYVVTTFGVQGTSHFVLNKDHYATISIMRQEPLIPLGVTSMVIQGLIFAWLFPIFRRAEAPVRSAIVFSLTIGAFLASYIVLGEAGKYSVPSLSSWITVEASAALVQYTVFGTLLDHQQLLVLVVAVVLLRIRRWQRRQGQPQLGRAAPHRIRNIAC